MSEIKRLLELPKKSFFLFGKPQHFAGERAIVFYDVESLVADGNLIPASLFSINGKIAGRKFKFLLCIIVDLYFIHKVNVILECWLCKANDKIDKMKRNCRAAMAFALLLRFHPMC